MEFEKIVHIKRIALKALFSDDLLSKYFVLKGGSAIDLAFVYHSGRASIDIDLSMPLDFPIDLNSIAIRIQKSLSNEFKKFGYMVFDCSIKPRPLKRHADLPKFWKGYFLKFKLLTLEKHLAYKDNLEKMRKYAEIIGPSSSVKIDISCYEYCDNKIQVNIDGSNIFVYSPQMLVAEKLRAICQQMPEYLYIGQHTKRPRGKDFYDIYLIIENETGIFWESPIFFDIVEKTFNAKGVPIELLWKLDDKFVRNFHATDFKPVIETVSVELFEGLMDFDFYYESVVTFANKLKSFRNK